VFDRLGVTGLPGMLDGEQRRRLARERFG